MNALAPRPLPDPRAHLEEVTAETSDLAAGWGFAMARLAAMGDGRPWVVAAPRHALSERGRPSAQGLGARVLLVAVRKDAEALWALEEALKSGAVAGGVALVEGAPFVMTRRLDLAARSTRAVALLLRPRGTAELSAAALRWRAELVRRRDGAPGTFMVEHANEAYRLAVAARLADYGPVVDAARRSAA